MEQTSCSCLGFPCAELTSLALVGISYAGLVGDSGAEAEDYTLSNERARTHFHVPTNILAAVQFLN